MLCLQRWMRRHLAKNSPPGFVAVGVVGSMGLGVVLPLLGDGLKALPMILLLIAVAVVSWLPLFLHLQKIGKAARDRGRLIEAMLRQPSRHPLGDWVGPLEQAAASLEQINALVARSAFDANLSRDLTTEAEDRMRRVFDLAIGTPGDLGYSSDGARLQIELDLKWLARAQELVEASTTMPGRPQAGTVLDELEVESKARQVAVRELLGATWKPAEDEAETVKTA